MTAPPPSRPARVERHVCGSRPDADNAGSDVWTLLGQSEGQVRERLRRLLARPPSDVDPGLTDLGWHDLVDLDEGFAFTALFEEQGYAGARTNALDIAVGTALGLSHTGAAIVWPCHAGASAEDLGGSGRLFADGLVLSAVGNIPATVLVAAGQRMHRLAVSTIRVSAPDATSGWRHVQAWGTSAAELSSWDYVKRRGLLAIASELLGVTQRVLDLADHYRAVSCAHPRRRAQSRTHPPSPTSPHDGIARARELVATAWSDGSVFTAVEAKAAARAAYDASVAHAAQLCGAAASRPEHPLADPMRRGPALDAILGAAN